MPTKPESQDVDFVEAMHELLDMDEKAVEQLLDKLDTDDLQDLTDAVAKKDHDAAQQVIGRFNTDEEVNALFRGKNLDTGQDNNTGQKKKTAISNQDGQTQFAFGDDVQVTLTDENGKTRHITGTVSKPDGPEGTDTVVVRIKGKSKVIDKRNVSRLTETVIGMVGGPNLQRIQQLAGIPIQSEMQPETEFEINQPEPEPDDPIGQAMAALDTLEAALPNIILADLKTIRQRLNGIQVSMNESIGKASLVGRVRKL